MIVYKNHVTFNILDEDVHLFSEILDHGLNTVAEVGSRIHYLGKEGPTIAAAIIAWQEVNGRDLSDDELKKILFDNQSTSGAI